MDVQDESHNDMDAEAAVEGTKEGEKSARRNADVITEGENKEDAPPVSEGELQADSDDTPPAEEASTMPHGDKSNSPSKKRKNSASPKQRTMTTRNDTKKQRQSQTS